MFTEPISGDRFFGRHDILELLDKRVLALKDGYRQNVALTGPNLVGKSSIIHHFLYSIQSEDFIPIYVEVTKEPFRSFADKFIATMLYNALRKKGECCGIDLAGLVEKCGKFFPKTFHAITRLNSGIARGDYEDAYLDLLGLTSILRSETGISCIVLFDEFDNLENLGVKNPFQAFGKVIMVQKDTMYIVSSSRDEAIRKILSEKLSLLFGNFEIVKVANFDMNASNAYLDVRTSGFDLDARLRGFLISFTGGNPFYLEKISRRIIRIASEKMTNSLDKDIVARAIVELVYNSDGVIHQYLTNYLFGLIDTKSRDNSMALLTSIACGARRYADIAKNSAVRQKDAADILPRLAAGGIISKNGSYYNIEDPMLAFWLRDVGRMRRSLLVDGAFDKERLFLADILSLIGAFEEESGKSPSVRLAELFGAFTGDLVKVEDRSIRLPSFSKVEVKTGLGGECFVYASFSGNYWVVHPYEETVDEGDIINFIRNAKGLSRKITNKIIIPLKGMDDNARLLAKELKISIWELPAVNNLMALYGKKGIIAL